MRLLATASIPSIMKFPWGRPYSKVQSLFHLRPAWRGQEVLVVAGVLYIMGMLSELGIGSVVGIGSVGSIV